MLTRIFKKSFIIFFAFWIAFYSTFLGLASANIVKADGPVPGNDCGDSRYPANYFNGYICYIRGIYQPHSGFDAANNCFYTNKIQYSNGDYWYFCDPAHASLTNQEVIAKVQYIDNVSFIILQFVSYQVYNQAPNQPNLKNPQSNWDLGPKTNGTYSNITCNTAGTGQGCSVQFDTNVTDPDDTPPVNSTFNITNNTNAALSTTFSTTSTGDFSFTKTLKDGNWQWTGHSVDKYNADSSYPTPRSNIRVDTTAPTQPQINTLPTYSPGTQLNVSSTAITDNFVGGIEYDFQKADDTNFTANLVDSGWINAGNFTFASLSDGAKYYYRVKARDAFWNTTAWSNVQSSTQDAVSPVMSNLTISEQRISPKNQDGTKDSSQIDFDWSESNPKTSTIEILDSGNNVVRQYVEDTSAVTTGLGHTTWSWDGKNSSNAYVADGTYNVKVIVTDQATNQTIDNSKYIIIDNTPASLSVNQTTGSWYNVNSIGITGQTENTATLKITNTTTSEVQNPNVNGTTGFFGISPDPAINFGINQGANDFKFEVNDQVGNLRTDNYSYYREEVAPTLNITSLGSLIKNRRPTITLNLTDTGFNDGTNDYISGIDKNSVYLEITDAKNQTLTLVNNGTNVQTTSGTTSTTCTTTGTFGNSGPATCTFSFTYTQDLPSDGNYTITARVKDKAGNQSSDATSSFELDSHTYNTINAPTGGSVFNYSQIQLKGTAEKGATMNITVPDVNGDGTTDSATFTIDTSSTVGRITVNNCRASSSPTTDGIKEICDWSLDNFQLEKNDAVNANMSNPISFKVTDVAGNVDTQTVTVNVNVRAVTVTAGSDLQYFSPNGDGRQDGMTFNNLSTNGVLGTWELDIKNSTNQIVKSFTGNSSVPTNIPWDGRDNNGVYLTDGSYTFDLSVTTTDNLTFSTTPQTIEAVTSLNNKVIITYPGNNTFTNQGVAVIQGQAPIGTKVRICIDVIGMPAACDYEVNDVSVNSNGSFSVLVPIFRIGGQTSTQNYISAFAYDKYGNVSPESNKVKITLTTNTPFKSIDIVPAYVGINSSADYQQIIDDLNNNKQPTALEIQNLRHTIIRSTVNQGTERVKLSYADYTNLSEFPKPINYNYIGYITDDPTKTPAEDRGLYYLNTPFVDDKYNQCNQTTCTWDFMYPIPPVPGGLYEIKFDGKLGSTIQTLTNALILDGNIPAAPLILDIDKMENGSQLNTNLFQNKYYSNSNTVVIKGVSDGNNTITVKDQNNNTICTTTSSSIGFWSCQATLAYANPQISYSLSVQASDGTNTANSVSATSLVIDKQAPQISSLTTAHGASTSAWYRSGDVVDTSLTANEMLSYAINKDTTTLGCASTSVQSGAISDFDVTANYLGASGSYTVPGNAPEGRYCTQIEVQDIAGNRTDKDMVLLIDNTIPNVPVIDTSTWGVYNGINSQPYFPALGRLNPGFVIKDKTLYIYGYAEENQTVELYVDGTKRSEVQAVPNTAYGAGNCMTTLDSNNQPLTGDDVKDSVTVEYQYQCLYFASFTFDKGEKGYEFQVKTKDQAGNESGISQSELVYYDKTPPRTPETVNVMGNGNTIHDWIYAKNQDVTATKLGTGNFGKLPITNSKNITVYDFAESLSDMQYTSVDKNGNTFSQYVKQKAGTGLDNRNYSLSAGDGVYTFYAQSWDAPGNASGVHLFQIELDTIAPNSPNVSGGMSGLYNIVMSISGEPGSTSVLGKLPSSGHISGTIRTLDINKDSDWSTTMTFCSKLTDRAGNSSGSRCFSVNTPVRPVRPGECNWTADMQKKYDELINSGTADLAKIADQLGFSLSCQTYASDQINSGLKNGDADLTKRKQDLQNCVDQKVKDGKSGTDAIADCGGASVLGLQNANNYADSINKQQREQQEAIKKQAEKDRNDALLKIGAGVIIGGLGIACAILTVGIGAGLCAAGAIAAGAAVANETINAIQDQHTIDTGIKIDIKSSALQFVGVNKDTADSISHGIDTASNVALVAGGIMVTAGVAIAVAPAIAPAINNIGATISSAITNTTFSVIQTVNTVTGPGVTNAIMAGLMNSESVATVIIGGAGLYGATNAIYNCATGKTDKPCSAGDYVANTAQAVVSAVSIIAGVSSYNNTLNYLKQSNEESTTTCTGTTCGKVDENGNSICFVKGTLVQTIKGLVPIEQIKVGDLVLSKDPITGKEEYKEVLHTYLTHAEYITQIWIGDQKIEATPVHRFWVSGYGWLMAKELKVGMKFVDKNEKKETITKLDQIYAPQDTYNLEVADYHTYFVGKLGVWVHNQSSESCSDNTISTNNKVNQNELNEDLENEKINNNLNDNQNSKSDKLNWNAIVSNDGETREEHVNMHGIDDTTKQYHGVFADDPIETTNDAWNKRGNIQPQTINGKDIYIIPYPNAGLQGGYAGNGQILNNVMIVTQSGTNNIITAYPY